MPTLENTYDLLAARYDVGFAQQIADQLADIESRDIELFDIMAINEVAEELRQEIKGIFAHYRAAHAESRAGEQTARRVYAGHKTYLLRRQISDLWKLYRMARTDSRELTNEYMRRLEASSFYPASQTAPVDAAGSATVEKRSRAAA
jgi:ATP-dependent Lon protease